MNKLLMFIAFFFFAKNASAQINANGFTITTTMGEARPLQSFNGKRVMVVVLPGSLTADDSIYLQRIDSVAQAMENVFTVIAVPSFEDGYHADSANTLMNAYSHMLGSHLVVISQPLFTHASSGAQQDSFFNWLTHAALNTHFDREVSGPGTMFFLNDRAELYGAFGPEAKWSNRVLVHVSQ